MTQDTYRRTAAGQHPANLSPEYKSTTSRAPRQPPIVLPQSLSEITGPLLVGERLDGRRQGQVNGRDGDHQDEREIREALLLLGVLPADLHAIAGR